jgi:hypothetical protein
MPARSPTNDQALEALRVRRAELRVDECVGTGAGRTRARTPGRLD